MRGCIISGEFASALADGLKRQAAAYASASTKHILPAYELVAVVGQPQPGRDGRYRRRESYAIIDRMLQEARAAGFKLILDVQTGHSVIETPAAPSAPARTWTSPSIIPKLNHF